MIRRMILLVTLIALLAACGEDPGPGTTAPSGADTATTMADEMMDDSSTTMGDEMMDDSSTTMGDEMMDDSSTTMGDEMMDDTSTTMGGDG